MAGEPPVHAPVRFGPFELFVESGELRKDGVRLKLSGQPIQVLISLVAASGRLVTREELQHQLWPASSFGDFEKGLNAAVNRLRENLHDSAHDPKYIETIPGRGYRFIHPVEPMEKQPPDTTSPAVQPKAGDHRRLWIALSSFAVVLLGLGTILLLRGHRMAALTEKDTVVLADFANTTGDPVFTDTLRQGLLVQLNQSPFLEILSDDKVRATLGQMERQPQDTLNDQVAREVCERNQSKAFIAGSIASLGSQYVLGLKAVNCKTGDVLVQQQNQVAKREEVLDSLSKQASLLRRRLGESLPSVEKFDVPLEQATTSSLEALQAYSLGRKQQSQENFSSAITFFQRAIELDPNFAMAYASLAATYGMCCSDRERVEENFNKAYALRQKVTFRERLRIDASYYLSRGEMERPIQTYELWKSTYPQDVIPYINLTDTYATLGELNKALEAGREAYRRDPSVMTSDNLLERYLTLGRVQEAKQLVAEAEPRYPGNSIWSLWHYWIAFFSGDRVEMVRLLKAAPSGSEQELNVLSVQCETEAYYGRLKSARESCRHVVDWHRRHGANGVARRFLDALARSEAYFGNSSEARQLAAEIRSLGGFPAFVYANSGDVRQAQALDDELARKYPNGELLNMRYFPLVRAVVDIRKNNPSQAVQTLEKTSSVELGDLNVVYIRGQAYLLSHRGTEAAAEFQKIIDHPGYVWLNWPGYNAGAGLEVVALAHLGMARARALEGDTAKARAEYEHFLTLWKDADSDIPIYQQAKAEYAKLH